MYLPNSVPFLTDEFTIDGRLLLRGTRAKTKVVKDDVGRRMTPRLGHNEANELGK